jgi:uncharacterized protein (DUF2267 family)
MTHDEFVGQVQHRAHLPSRGDAETIIRATLETLGERLQKHAAAHVAAQLPLEIGRHLKGADHFEHLTLHDFYQRAAEREGTDYEKAVFHTQVVLDTLREAITPGAVKKLQKQMPQEFQELLLHATV